ncbi:MAG: hypothetical protein J0H67_01530 [Rhodospirillales bacterium]|nr:hypothetical protein [Rhodospirillales bacterium]
MRFPHVVPFGLLLSCGLLAGLTPGARAQTGTLQVPTQKTQEAPPKPPAAAPRQSVQQVAPSSGSATKHPPVVQPHGTPHAQKPAAAKPGTKPAAAPAAATKPEAPAAVPVPVPAAPAEPAPAKPVEAEKPGKLPVPRFAALRFDEVNMRVGPGPRYPIAWVYKRRDLPVEIEREFDIWRLIRDPDGVRGWVGSASLTGRRTFIVTGAEATLHRDANDTSAAVAILQPGVIGRIRYCAAEAAWCQVQTGEYRGYLKRTQFWGIKPGEAVNP